MLASSVPLGVPGLLPVTLRSERGEYIKKLGEEDCISRKMGVQVKKAEGNVDNRYLWDAGSYVQERMLPVENTLRIAKG